MKFWAILAFQICFLATVNLAETDEEWKDRLISDILERNPEAFRPKITSLPRPF